ncbi:MAG: tetratricopeptide repeat protein [Ignavibacteriaceae bacterium]
MSFRNFFILLFLLGFSGSSVFAQIQEGTIDSMKILIGNSSGKVKIDVMNQLGSLYKVQDAQNRIDIGKEALALAQKLNYQKGIAEAHTNIGRGYYWIYKPDSSLLHLQKAYALVSDSDNKRLIAEILMYQGDTQDRKANFRLASEIHHRSLEIYKSLKDTLLWAESVNSIGLNHWRLGEYDDAEKYFNIYLDLSRKTNHLAGIGDALNNLGILKWNRGQSFDALVFYLESLKTREAIRDSANATVTMNNIALIYKKLGDSQKTFDYLTKSLKVAKKVYNKFPLAYTYENLGNYYLSRNDFDAASDNFNDALKTYTEINFRAGITDINNAIGNLHFAKGEFSQALPYFRTAYERSTLVEDRKARIASLNNLGKVYIKLQKLREAEESLLNALSIAREAKIPDYLKDTNGFLAELYDLKGMPGKAYLYLKAYTELNDSLFSIQTSTMINEIKEQYDTESKERENILLRDRSNLQSSELEVKKYVLIFSGFVFGFFIVLTGILYYFYSSKKKAKEEADLLNTSLAITNQRLQESESELKELNKTKAKFFSIIAHDLKNPFHVLMGFSDILYSGFDELDSVEKKEMINSIKETSGSAQKLLSNLLEWARFQTGKLKLTKENTDISLLLHKEIAAFTPTARLKNINITHRISSNIVLELDPDMISTVIRNLLANAVKFTPENGTVEIITGIKDNMFSVSVKDNGVGMNEKTVNSLFRIGDIRSAPGTGGEKGTGLGLILAHEFIEEHGGSLRVESEPGKGSSFTFMLPLRKN